MGTIDRSPDYYIFAGEKLLSPATTDTCVHRRHHYCHVLLMWLRVRVIRSGNYRSDRGNTRVAEDFLFEWKLSAELQCVLVEGRPLAA